mgnify:CR=1 FL=1
MDKKDILMVVVIAAVVGVVASLITSNVSDVGMSPDILPRDIIAHACNGDGICETNSILVGKAGSGSSGSISVENKVIAGSLEANSLRIDRNSGFGLTIDQDSGFGLKIDQGSGFGLTIDQGSGFGLKIDQGSGYGLKVTNNGSGYALAADGRVMFKNLETQGTGNFLCIAETGVIFRSNSSCN